MPITLEWHGLQELVDDLKAFRKRALPYAVRSALNTAAFDARSQWQHEIRRSFTLRNRYTERSVRVTRVEGTDLRRMVAIVGSVAPYMGDQEHGATVRARRRKKAIPAPGAAGQPPGKTRTKLIRRPHRLSSIRVPKATGGTVKQRWAAAIGEAVRKRRRFVLLDRPGGGRGIYRVTGGGRRRRPTLRLLYDVSRRTVRVPAEPTLQRTLRAMGPKLPHIYRAALLAELRRNRILGY